MPGLVARGHGIVLKHTEKALETVDFTGKRRASEWLSTRTLNTVPQFGCTDSEALADTISTSLSIFDAGPAQALRTLIRRGR